MPKVVWIPPGFPECFHYIYHAFLSVYLPPDLFILLGYFYHIIPGKFSGGPQFACFIIHSRIIKHIELKPYAFVCYVCQLCVPVKWGWEFYPLFTRSLIPHHPPFPSPLSLFNSCDPSYLLTKPSPPPPSPLISHCTNDYESRWPTFPFSHTPSSEPVPVPS